VRLEYVQQGNPHGVPVIMLHGFTDSWRSFERVLPYLPDSLNAFAITQRGHGDSEHPEQGYEVRDFVADVAAFMDALGIGQAIVVGHSMGSIVAQRFALDYPDRALGLVLLGTFVSIVANPATAEFAAVVATLEDPIETEFARDFQVATVALPVPAVLIDTAVEESMKVPARVWRDAFAGMMQEDFAVELGNISAPTLVIYGDQDAFCLRSDQDAIVAGYPDAELLVYQGYGHAMHWEDPARVAADLVVFVRRLLSAQRRAA
jgi:pimeloyl-ACP methyl ester carboxylesterase